MKLLCDLIAIHAVCDWFLQNEWMAKNKNNWRHPAGYVHAFIHGVAVLAVLAPALALLVFITHWLIDLRIIIPAWRKMFKQGGPEAVMLHMSFWQDQVLHFLVLYVIARFLI